MLPKTPIEIVPRDLLFSRDAKPMEGSYAGNGANLPNPMTLHGAFLAALHRYFPEKANLEKDATGFDKLQTVGPFLTRNGELFFPTPLDIYSYKEDGEQKSKLMTLRKLSGSSNLPKLLEYAIFAGKATKDTPPKWISQTELERYLWEGKVKFKKGDRELFNVEKYPGITIDPRKRCVRKKDSTTEDQNSQIYFANYLRLKKGVSLSCFVDIEMSDSQDKSTVNGLFNGKAFPLQLGGQGTIVDARKSDFALPDFLKPTFKAPKTNSLLLKWVLLTPTGWTINQQQEQSDKQTKEQPVGWIPCFVNPQNGEVRLAEMPNIPQKPGETRKQWRKRLNESARWVHARLVAARIGKPVYFSGWKMTESNSGTSRPTHAYVPAGSVYYFEAETKEDFQLLFKLLNGQARSDFGGNCGFGFGVCGLCDNQIN